MFILGGLLASSSCIESPAPAGAGTPQKRVATAPSNGFGNDIAWRSLDDGLAEAQRDGRPMMLLVHASWCPKCKALKPAFSDTEIVRLSERFVMVNADQDRVPKSETFAPDGTYIPRVVFVDPTTGKVDDSLRNPARNRQLYYFSRREDLVGVMRKALQRHERS